MVDFLQNLADAINLGSIYALTALGIGLLFGILRLINFAHGDFITVGAYALIVPSADVTARLFIGAFDWVALVPSVCAIVIAIALATEAVIFRPLRRSDAPTLMIASFAVSSVIQNGIIMLYGSRPKAVNLWPILNLQLRYGDLRLPLTQIVTVAVTLLLMAGLMLFLKRTAVGIGMRAAAEDFRMAQYLGVRSNVVIGVAFAISGLLAATVSLLFMSQSGALNYQLGMPLALFGFVAVVIGGMGSLGGAVLGGFLVGIIVTMLQAYLPLELRDFRDAFAFAAVIAVLLIRPAGLLPAKTSIDRV